MQVHSNSRGCTITSKSRKSFNQVNQSSDSVQTMPDSKTRHFQTYAQKSMDFLPGEKIRFGGDQKMADDKPDPAPQKCGH